MFEEFPKKRPELPAEYMNIYNQHYKDNREGNTKASSMAQRMESWLHRKVAKDIKSSENDLSTLEIGAGTLNQLPYERESKIYDIVEPYELLFEDSENLKRIDKVYSDISDVPSKKKYDRITSIAVLEHILNLPEVVARAALLLEDNGHFRAAIPNEGTFLWKLGWKITTGAEFKKKYGLDYEVLMNYEHVNTADEIEKVLKYFFKRTRCKVFGLNKALGIYRFYDCMDPDPDAAKAYLEEKR